MRGIHRWPKDSPHKGPVTGTMFPFDDIIMIISDAPPGNIALRRASWQSSEYKETPASRGVDGNIYSRSCIRPKQGNAYFAVDFNSTVGLWNVRVVIQQQGGWQQSFTPSFLSLIRYIFATMMLRPNVQFVTRFCWDICVGYDNTC